MIRAPSRAKLRYNSITSLLLIQILLYIITGHVESMHVMGNLHSSQVCLLIMVLIDLETVRERHPRWPAWWFEQCADEFEGGVYGYEQGDWEVSIYLSLPGCIRKCDRLTNNFNVILVNVVHVLWHWVKRCVVICYRQAPGVEHLSSDIQELNNRVRGANLRGQKLLRRWFLRIIIYLTWLWPMLEVCTLSWRPWRVPSCHKVLIWSISLCKYLFVVDDVGQGSLLWLRFRGENNWLTTKWPNHSKTVSYDWGGSQKFKWPNYSGVGPFYSPILSVMCCKLPTIAAMTSDHTLASPLRTISSHGNAGARVWNFHALGVAEGNGGDVLKQSGLLSLND